MVEIPWRKPCDAGAPGRGMLGMPPTARCLPALFFAGGLWKRLGWVGEGNLNIHGRDLEREKTTLGKALHTKGLDFSAASMAVTDLHSLLKRHPQGHPS